MSTIEIRFTDAHQWARREDGGLITFGITDRAVDRLERRVVAVDLPKVGEACVRSTPYGVLDSAKGAFDLVAPITGTVSRINSDTLKAPDLVIRDPFGTGWLIQISPSNPADFESLLSASEYERMCSQVPPVGR